MVFRLQNSTSKTKAPMQIAMLSKGRKGKRRKQKEKQNLRVQSQVVAVLLGLFALIIALFFSSARLTNIVCLLVVVSRQGMARARLLFFGNCLNCHNLSECVLACTRAKVVLPYMFHVIHSS